MTETAKQPILTQENQHQSIKLILVGDFGSGKSSLLHRHISNTFDVFFNITHMTAPWKIGNIIADKPQVLVDRVLREDTPAHRRAKQVTWAELACRYGDTSSEKAFSLDDYKMFLFNTFLEHDDEIRL